MNNKSIVIPGAGGNGTAQIGGLCSAKLKNKLSSDDKGKTAGESLSLIF